jgi:hypothetical protein
MTVNKILASLRVDGHITLECFERFPVCLLKLNQLGGLGSGYCSNDRVEFSEENLSDRQPDASA